MGYIKTGLAWIAASALLIGMGGAAVGCQMLRSKDAPGTIVIDGFSSPESVIADASGKRFFVSNVGEKLEPSLKDADGYISELTPEGTLVNKKFLPKDGVLNSPKGMAVIGGTLYAADIDRVVGFDLKTRDKIFEMDFSPEKTVFLNDLAVMDDNTLVLSATDIGKIYKITLGEKPSYSILAENIPGVNGLYFDNGAGRLYAVSFGEGSNMNGGLGVIKMNETNPKYEALTGRLGALDGIALLPGGRIIFSDWVAFDKPGVIRVFDRRTKELSYLGLSQDARGPADFYYDAISGYLWLPRMMEGKILIEYIR